jgi:hypothetical protein
MEKEVIIIGCNGFVLALSLITGEENWRVKLRAGVLSSSRGSDVSVLVDAERISCLSIFLNLSRIAAIVPILLFWSVLNRSLPRRRKGGSKT